MDMQSLQIKDANAKSEERHFELIRHNPDLHMLHEPFRYSRTNFNTIA